MAATNVQAFSGDLDIAGAITSNLEVGTANLFVDTVNSRVGIGTNDPDTALTVTKTTSATDSVIFPLHVRAVSSGSVANGFGSGIKFQAERFDTDAIQSHAGSISVSGIGNPNLPSAQDRWTMKFTVLDDDTLRDAMHIKYDGNVGIGTNNPGAPLEVYTTTEGNSSTLILKRDVTTYGNSDDGAAIEFKTKWTGSGTTYGQVRIRGVDDELYDSGEGGIAFDTLLNQAYYERMRIRSNGNVGIGVAVPQSPLTVYNSDGIHITPTYTVNYSQTSQLDFNYGGGTSAGTLSSVRLKCIAVNRDNGAGPNYDYGAQGKLIFQGKTNNLFSGSASHQTYTDIMTVDGSTHCLGIGTTNPGSLLNLNRTYPTPSFNAEPATDYVQGILFGNNLQSYDAGGKAWVSVTPIDAARIWYQPVGYNAAASNQAGVHGKLNFGVGFTNSTTNTARLTITSDGRVGVGTTNPYAQFHVHGYTGAITGNTRRYFSWSDPGGEFPSRDSNVVYQDASGQNGWGGMSVYGQGSIVTSSYFVSHKGTIYASDRRIKKDIIDTDNAECLELMRKLKPKRYKYIDEVHHTDAVVWGFIAQDVDEIVESSVNVGSDELPNIMELADTQVSNVIIFNTFNTSNLNSNTTKLSIRTEHDLHSSVTISEIIDEHTIRVEEDLSEFTSQDNTKLFVYGEYVNDFKFLKHDTIWTLTTAALKEVDRQLQTEKAKVSTLETQLASVLTRLDALEGA